METITKILYRTNGTMKEKKTKPISGNSIFPKLKGHNNEAK